jgi:hypothetical protein
MSQVPGSDYSIYDIISRIIPGSIALYVLLSLSYNTSDTVGENPLNELATSPTLLIIFVGFSLLTGEILQFSRNKLNPVPFPLRREIYRQTRNRNFLPLHDQWRRKIWDWLSSGYTRKLAIPLGRKLQLGLFEPPQRLSTKTREGFWRDFKYRFSVDDDFDHAKDVYGILIAYLEPHMTSDLRRSRAVVDFMNNLIIASLFLVYASIINIPAFGGLDEFPLVSFIGLILFFLPGMIFAFGFIERHYVNRLLLEYFYRRRLEEEAEDLSQKNSVPSSPHEKSRSG